MSIGAVVLDPADSSPVDTLSDADTACYQAKEEGRNRMHLFNRNDTELARRRGEMHWVTRINDTIEQQRLILFRQPILPLSGTQVVPEKSHFEMLLRMRGDDGACVSAQACLGAAERFHLTTSIDRWVVTSTLNWLDRDEAERARLGLRAINLSGHSVGNPDFLEFLRELIATSLVPPEKICFEITETAAVTRLDRATRFMEALREHGCRFTLEDFGSGMSSFGYLQHLPADFIKVDGQFVRDMATNPMNRTMVRSINEISHVLGKRTIAEFVESDEILHLLRTVCDLRSDNGFLGLARIPRQFQGAQQHLL